MVVHQRLSTGRYPSQAVDSSAAVHGAEGLALAAAAAAPGGSPEGEAAPLVRRH